MEVGCALYPIHPPHTVCLQKPPPPRTAQCLSFTQFLLRIDPRGGSIALALPSSFLPWPDYQLRPPSVLNRNRKGFFFCSKEKEGSDGPALVFPLPENKVAKKEFFVAQLPNFSSFFYFLAAAEMDSGHGIIGKWGKREVGGGGPRDNIDSVPSREEEEEEAAFL